MCTHCFRGIRGIDVIILAVLLPKWNLEVAADIRCCHIQHSTKKKKKKTTGSLEQELNRCDTTYFVFSTYFLTMSHALNLNLSSSPAGY